MNKQGSILVLVLFLIATVWSCTEDKDKNIPNVSNIKVEAKIDRLEREMFNLDTTNIQVGLQKLVEAHGAFMDIYLNVIMRDLMDPTKTSEQLISDFITSSQVQSLYDTCMIAYENIEPLEQEFEQAFKFYKYYFPDNPTPKIVSYISEFGLGTFAYGDSLLAVGWDFYLGENYPYEITYFPRYVQKGMSKEYIVSKSMEALVSNIIGDVRGTRLIDHMIHNGKMIYLVDKLTPRTSDTIKLVYSTEQLKWCEENELQMWTHLLGEKLLYSSRMKDFQKLISPSPSSAPQMPPESPGRTANWIGWQIVKRYMKLNPQETIADLIAEEDAQYILDKSKYKPR